MPDLGPSAPEEMQASMGELLYRLSLDYSAPGPRQDIVLSDLILQRAAERGHAGAQWALALPIPRAKLDEVLCPDSFDSSIETQASVDWSDIESIYTEMLQRRLGLLGALAEDGNPHSAFLLGALLKDQGEFTRKAQLFSQAADAGLNRARVFLGLMYAEGEGVGKDLDRAIALLEEAADLNPNEGALALGAILKFLGRSEEEHTRGKEILLPLAQAGDPRALLLLATSKSGRDMVANTDQASLENLYKAARANEPAAMRLLGQLYESGTGLKQNRDLAMKWLTRAAELGDPIAQAWCSQRLS